MADENAPACESDTDTQCDLDPRDSTPIHRGLKGEESMKKLRKSLRKAAVVVREMGLALAAALAQRALLEELLGVIVRCLAVGIHSHHSKADPRTYQLLEHPEIHGLAGFQLPEES